MTKSATREAADEVSAPIASPSFTGNVGINNSSPTQRLETNGNAQFNMYDDPSGAGGYYTTKGMQIGNAFDAGLSGGDDDRNAIVWNERGTSLLFGTNNIERMRINAAGIVTKPLQPAFLAQGANAQNNIAVGSTSTILLPSERFDNNNDFSSNTFTAPVTGKYQLNSHVYLLQMPTNSSYFETYLVTSNKTYAGAITPSSYGGGGISYISIEIAVLADMDAGDTAFLRISQGSGTQSTDVHQNTSFSGYLVC
jgi:hypothetical protein